MRKLLGTLILLLASVSAFADGVTSHTSRRFVKFTGAPTVCVEGDVYENLTSHTFWGCTAASTWTQLAVVGGNIGTTTGTALALGPGTPTNRQTLDVYSTASAIHVSATDVDSGFYIASTVANSVYMSAGSRYDGANWVARATASTILGVSGNVFNIFSNAGLTAGNTFSPTTRVTLDGTTGSMTLTGSLTLSSTLGLVGTTTNDSVNTGAVGEYVTGTTAANTTSLSTNTSANVGAGTNITLSAGDWDCTGVVNFTFGATTSVTNLSGGVSTTTATLPAQDSFFDFETSAIVPTASKVMTWVCPTVRLSLAGSTSVFLVTQATFSVSTITVGGTIRCRRVR
jgi:hypothetical protein